VKAPEVSGVVREVKMSVRRASHTCREVRKRWTALRAKTVDQIVATGQQADLEAIGALTLELWAAEAAQAEAAKQWRAVLAEREALPTAERWNLVEMERWAAKQLVV
jgi:hypothetical protein